jgi:putative two-component system response regulator
MLAQHLRKHPRFKQLLGRDLEERLFEMAALHDIGKIGVPDQILLKPSTLSENEFEEMKKHTLHGANALSLAERELKSSSFLRLARRMIASHHERWDGKGYPKGLKEDDIPVEGRLMAVADVYDALISRRVYKEALPHEEAVQIMRSGRGTQFDPDILEAFLELEKEFQRIASEYPDGQSENPGSPTDS